MPYIKPEDRINKDGPISELAKVIKTPGDLNYIFSCLAIEYFLRNGGRYQQINDVDGVFGCASKEFYRRIAVPYEDKKIQETGDLKQLELDYMKNWDIWCEGFKETLGKGKAWYVGTATGPTFKEACEIKFGKNENYNLEYNSINGSKLFDNETEARKAYG